MKMVIIVSSLVMSFALNAQMLQGKVVRVVDGDTNTILDATNAQNKVRLNKIDAPEKKQAFGEVSRKHLASMVAGKIVNVDWEKKDKSGRILGDISIGTTNVNLRMVQDGLAWHFKAFDNTPAYAQAENEARVKKIGLWKDVNPIPLWEFRKAKKGKGDS